MMQGAFHPALRDNSLHIIRALPESSGGDDSHPQMSPASKSGSSPGCFMCTALKFRQRRRQKKLMAEFTSCFGAAREFGSGFFFSPVPLTGFCHKILWQGQIIWILVGKKCCFLPSGSNSSIRLGITQCAATGISSQPDSLQYLHLCKNYDVTKQKRIQTTRTGDCHREMIK